MKIAPLFAATFKEDGMLALCGARSVTMVRLPDLERRPSAKKVSANAVSTAAWTHGDRLIASSVGPGRGLLLDFLGNRIATLKCHFDKLRRVWCVFWGDCPLINIVWRHLGWIFEHFTLR